MFGVWMLKGSLYCLGVELYNEKQGKKLSFYRDQTRGFPLSFGNEMAFL